MRVLPPLNSVERLEDAAALDPAIDRLRSVATAVLRPRWLRDILHGVPTGHPLHPVAVLVPVGAWMSAAVLDLVPGTDKAVRVLVGTGVASALPSAVAGWADWSQLHKQQQRVGIVHAAANITAVALYTASLIERNAGRVPAGKALAFAGLGAVMFGGFLGGHLSFRQASGANHAEDVPHRVQPGWHRIDEVAELPDNALSKRMLGDVPLVVYRRGDEIQVLSDNCSHLSGPLHEGTIVGGSDPCVVCPWHKSTFSLRTGEVRHGPATSRQPSFSTRIVDGQLEVSLPGVG